MAQAGFSGEPRYSLPGAALVAVAGALRARRRPRDRRAASRGSPAPLLLVAAAPKLADLPDLRATRPTSATSPPDLADVIDRAGGREALLACGRPYVGDLRGPLLAYHLDVEKQRVGVRAAPAGRRVPLAHRGRRAGRAAYRRRRSRHAARVALWEVREAC